MDLIDRKAAVSAISDLILLKLNCARMPTWNEVYHAIGDISAVPAVPLDKLCKWLANSFADPPCCLLENVRCKMECRGFSHMDYSECWRYVLTKCMEGLDAAD